MLLLSQSTSCRSHTGPGDMDGPQSPNGSCPFAAGRTFTQHRRKRRNFLDGSSRLTFLQQAVTFHLFKRAATSSLLRSGNKGPARQGKAECSKLLLWEGNASVVLLSPVMSAGAQDLGSDLMTKMEPMSRWTDYLYSAWCHQQQHHARRTWRWKRMQD